MTDLLHYLHHHKDKEIVNKGHKLVTIYLTIMVIAVIVGFVFFWASDR